jgi:hypothetical protein
MPPASNDLARTRALFEHWRATRQCRSKIPEELWQAAIALHGRYSASQLCHELRLSAGALRSRLTEGACETFSARPAFVPVRTEPGDWPAPTVPLVSVAEVRLVWERADGTRLHLSVPASQWTLIEALCTAFFRS